MVIEPVVASGHSVTAPVAPLVGRTDELAVLRAAVTAPPAILVIEGEAGVGKSRLLTEVRRGSEGHSWLSGYCESLQEPFPLGPVLGAIRDAAAALPPVTALNPVTGALAPLLPELAGWLPPPPPPLADQRAERHRVFRAAEALLTGIGPAVLAIEDLHWADEGTRDFLAFLAARLPPSLVLAITVRTGHGYPPLGEALGEALARSPVGEPVRVRVPPLTPHEVEMLARRLIDVAELPSSLAGKLFAELFEKTAGIPFVVEEVLRTLRGQAPAPAETYLHALGELEVPAVLRDALLQRLGSLDETTREVLGAAAVLGAVPDQELLATVTDRDAGVVARSLGQALTAGLLHERDGACRFRHALARQVVDEALPAPTRRWLHLSAALALEARPGNPPVARLAHHFRQAGRPADYVRYAEAAADVALSHGDDATAARQLLSILDLEDLPSGTPVRLAVKLGRAAVDGLAHSEAAPILQRLLADDSLPVPVRGELRFMLGRMLRQQGAAGDGYVEVERAVADLHHDPGLRARALALLSVPDTVVGRHAREHLARCDEAVSAAAGSADPRVGVAVAIARASLYLALGDRRSRRVIESLRGDPHFLDDPREQARAYLNWAQGALNTGHPRWAESLLAEGGRVVADAGYLRLASIVELVQAAADRALGRWERLEQRIRGLQSNDFAAANLDAEFLLGELLVAVGSADEAQARLYGAITAAERAGAIWPLVPARAALARLLLTGGRPEEAIWQAAAGLEQVRAKGCWSWGAGLVLSLVDGAVAVGRAAEAAGPVDELAAGLAGADAPVPRALLRVCRAVLVRQDGGVGEADRLLTGAHRQLRTAGMQYELALTTERQGAWRCADGADGGPQMEAALRSLGSLGAERDVARVRQTMRAYGVPVPYPWRGGRRHYGHRLSPREQQVAGLAAAGRTNQEIAEQLFLSRRTVESHVANVLRKLGGGSRRELAGLLGELTASGG